MLDYTTKIYTAISQLETHLFNQLEASASFYFSKNVLTAFEKSNPDISYQYIVFDLQGTAIALAVIQTMDVALDQAVDTLPLSQKLGHSLGCYLSGRSTRITICGNIFLSGAYGLWVKDEAHRRGVYLMLSRKLKTISAATKARILFLKDFNAEHNKAAAIVEKEHFQPLDVEPNMILHIQWDTFEAYKKSLRSKYRVKINKADSKSNALVRKPLSAIDIKNNLALLQSLHTNTTERALFKTHRLQLETYAYLKETMRDSLYVYGYYIDHKMVGFMTAFKVEDHLDAHFIGIDYAYNKTNAVYQRILNDYIRLGIDLEVKRVNLGRTASEIKSTLGAIPEPLVCYVKHRRTLANVLFKPLVKQIKITPYKQHRPFKK